tara:strand:- start:350 stop:562 length:213 start_codon:yes stop_codon:yes gene_type:complete
MKKIEVLDIHKNSLSVGDECAFTSCNYIQKGYVYKITKNKIFVTIKHKSERPYPDSHMPHGMARHRILKL